MRALIATMRMPTFTHYKMSFVMVTMTIAMTKSMKALGWVKAVPPH